MVRKARVWFDEEQAWNPENSEDGGVAVQLLTEALSSLSAGESLPETPEAEPDTEPVSDKTSKKPARSQRHLAGANWLDDWTLYWPSSRTGRTVPPTAK